MLRTLLRPSHLVRIKVRDALIVVLWYNKDMIQFYSYLWLREDTTPYYAGKGSGRRAFVRHSHLYPPLAMSSILIFPHSTEAEAFESEKAFIKWFGRKDIGTGCLRNFTEGGEGKTGRIANLETRRRMSEAQKGNKKSVGYRHMLGLRHTEETKAQLSEAHKGQNNRLGCHETEEQRNRKRMAQRLRRFREAKTKTHCCHGHLLTQENCIAGLWKRGRKKCRICANAFGRKRYWSHKS